jgi:hypothetical protein
MRAARAAPFAALAVASGEFGFKSPRSIKSI